MLSLSADGPLGGDTDNQSRDNIIWEAGRVLTLATAVSAKAR